MGDFKRGDTVYIIENGRIISPARIVNCAGGMYTLQLIGKFGALRVKKHRLFANEKDAKTLSVTDKHKYNPYNFM